MNEQLKKLQLTEDDFKLLMQGLEAIPQRNMAADLMADIFFSAVTKEDPSKENTSKENLAALRHKNKFGKEQKNELLNEEVKILQVKLLMLKRYLHQEGALNDAYNIIKGE